MVTSCLRHCQRDNSRYVFHFLSLFGSVHGTCQSPHILAVFVDCIFTDWAGFASPLNVEFQGVGSVRNSTFRNMHLHSEIADVSFDGMAHFEDVRFANVTLERGVVVGTTLNDYQQAIGVYIQYYGDDDAELLDMELTPVPEAESGVLGEEFVIKNDSISDCASMTAVQDVRGRPGCSAAAITAAQNSMLARAGDHDREAYLGGDECELYSVLRPCHQF